MFAFAVLGLQEVATEEVRETSAEIIVMDTLTANCHCIARGKTSIGVIGIHDMLHGALAGLKDDKNSLQNRRPSLLPSSVMVSNLVTGTTASYLWKLEGGFMINRVRNLMRSPW